MTKADLAADLAEHNADNVVWDRHEVTATIDCPATGQATDYTFLLSPA